MNAKTLILGTILTLAAAPALADIGQVKNLEGDVQVERSGKQMTLGLGDRLEQHDVVLTGPDSKVGITFVDNTRLSAGPNSRIEIAKFNFNETTHEGNFLTRIKSGSMAITSGYIAKSHPDAMQVKTPTSVLAVRGTRFLVKVD